MDTYAVEVTRGDGLWSAVVNGLPAGVSAGYDFDRFDELHDGVRDALIDLLGHDQFDLTWRYHAKSGDFTESLNDALTQAATVTRAREKLNRVRVGAIHEMHAAGLSYREIGDALGLSHQRVAQLNAHAPGTDHLAGTG